ncbi:diversity-generating retroelement protein Avd [Heyndrickxia coagulans]|uniref:diversity-generating retroelement protein Avd n=1 Tax=Heyndrickxia coagulans TaxID=1398 RepID=UPI00145991CE|nr:diversity-generating retroelement protein Avd [Heyndrickxia coagulans]NMH83254.1 diversity-generating retroelement protein Avd [Heyndrickxia coagulans]
MEQDLKILQKSFDMLKYGYSALRQFPKSERFTLAADIKQSMYSIIHLIIRANKRFYKKTTFQDIDIELEYLRYLIRLAMELGFLPFKKYEIWSKKINEIGRMLGGWIKSMK